MLKTIRGKTITIFAISLLLTCTVAAFYWQGINSLKYKLRMIEVFEDLFNDILEIRRFEKNFFLYQNIQSLDENLRYLNKVEHLTKTYSSDIERVVERDLFLNFIQNLDKYKRKILSHKTDPDSLSLDSQTVRSSGKYLADFAQELLIKKRERIHRAINTSTALIVIFLGIVLILQIAMMHILTRLLNPLLLIRQTTEKVAKGDFSSIPYDHSDRRDEISKLIHAFNRMAKELETNQEHLFQSRKIVALGTFSAGIAHELNNPLNNICLTAETLLEEFSEKRTPEEKELILDILNQADRAGEIIKTLLDFSRKDTLLFRELTVSEVITKTIKLVQNQIMLMGIEQKISLPDDLPLIRGDLRNLQQLFMNLLINAIQAMQPGGQITIDARDYSDKFVRINVSDTGHGIKPENLEHIFDPFYTTKGVGNGTGLGLAVTYGMVKKHGGYIEVQSEVGVGTTFAVYLLKSIVKEDSKLK